MAFTRWRFWLDNHNSWFPLFYKYLFIGLLTSQIPTATSNACSAYFKPERDPLFSITTDALTYEGEETRVDLRDHIEDFSERLLDKLFASKLEWAEVGHQDLKSGDVIVAVELTHDYPSDPHRVSAFVGRVTTSFFPIDGSPTVMVEAKNPNMTYGEPKAFEAVNDPWSGRYTERPTLVRLYRIKTGSEAGGRKDRSASDGPLLLDRDFWSRFLRALKEDPVDPLAPEGKISILEAAREISPDGLVTRYEIAGDAQRVEILTEFGEKIRGSRLPFESALGIDLPGNLKQSIVAGIIRYRFGDSVTYHSVFGRVQRNWKDSDTGQPIIRVTADLGIGLPGPYSQETLTTSGTYRGKTLVALYAVRNLPVTGQHTEGPLKGFQLEERPTPLTSTGMNEGKTEMKAKIDELVGKSSRYGYWEKLDPKDIDLLDKVRDRHIVGFTEYQYDSDPPTLLLFGARANGRVYDGFRNQLVDLSLPEIGLRSVNLYRADELYVFIEYGRMRSFFEGVLEMIPVEPNPGVPFWRYAR